MTWSEEDNRKLLLEWIRWFSNGNEPDQEDEELVDQFLESRKKGESS